MPLTKVVTDNYFGEMLQFRISPVKRVSGALFQKVLGAKLIHNSLIRPASLRNIHNQIVKCVPLTFIQTCAIERFTNCTKD